MPVPFILFALLTVAAWASAAWHAVLLLGHRKEGLTVIELMFQGYRFFDATTFTHEARHLHRRFIRSTLAFAFCVLLGIAVAAIRS